MMLRKLVTFAFALLLSHNCIFAQQFEYDNCLFEIIDRSKYEVMFIGHKPIENGGVGVVFVVPDKPVYDGCQFTVSKVGKNAFLNVASISLPSSVREIDFKSFDMELLADEYYLGSIIFDSDMPPSINGYDPDVENFFNSDILPMLQVYVPEGCLKNFENDYIWNKTCLYEGIRMSEDGVIYSIGRTGSTEALVSSAISMRWDPGWVRYKWPMGGIVSEITYRENNYCVSSIEENAFYSAFESVPQEMHIPASIRTVGKNAFGGADMKKIIFDSSDSGHDSEIKLEEGPFYYAMYLEDVEFNRPVFHLPDNCFAFTAIRNAKIPSSVTSVGNFIFDGCKSMDDITCYAIAPPAASEHSFSSTDDTNSPYTDRVVLYVPKGCVNDYRQAEGWNQFRHICEIDTDILQPEADDAEVLGEVFSISGTRVYSATESTKSAVEHCLRLPSGHYILRITHHSGNVSSRQILVSRPH